MRITITFCAVLWVNNRFSFLRQLQNKEENQIENILKWGILSSVISHFCSENIV